MREVTASAIADEVGMHKSAMLRYFETREDIFLRLAGDAWAEWSTAVRAELEDLAARPAAGRREGDQTAHEVAAVLARSLVARPLFCDLLAHTPLTLERNVSLERVKELKMRAIAAVAEVGSALCTVTPLRPTRRAASSHRHLDGRSDVADGRPRHAATRLLRIRTRPRPRRRRRRAPTDRRHRSPDHRLCHALDPARVGVRQVLSGVTSRNRRRKADGLTSCPANTGAERG